MKQIIRCKKYDHTNIYICEIKVKNWEKTQIVFSLVDLLSKDLQIFEPQFSLKRLLFTQVANCSKLFERLHYFVYSIALPNHISF